MNSTVEANVTHFCNFTAFSTSYKQVHGYLSIFVCVFGSIANVLNICILTSKKMRSPTNFILTGLALADLVVMVEYIPFASSVYLTKSTSTRHTYGWAVFTLCHAMIPLTFHFISCCITVMLAIWRYLAITYPQKSKRWCNTERTIATLLATYSMCLLLIVPWFSMSFQIRQYAIGEDNKTKPIEDLKNMTINEVDIKYIVQHTSNLRNYTFWIYSVIMKLLPCFLLTLLSYKLILALLEAKERRKLLLGKKSIPMDNIKGKKDKVPISSSNDQQADRTTRMLLAVLLLFLLTEFPQAIIGLLSGIIGPKFESQCYWPLGEYF